MNLVTLGMTGLQNWLLQRITAIILLFYVLFLSGYIVVSHFWAEPIDFLKWQALFNNPWMRLASLITLVSVSFHAWLGLWIIIQDYIKCTIVRLVITSSLLLVIFSYFIWGITILWRI